jgi:hypothetical protein
VTRRGEIITASCARNLRGANINLDVCHTPQDIAAAIGRIAA